MLLVLLVLCAVPARAQDDDSVRALLERIERIVVTARLFIVSAVFASITGSLSR